MAVSLGGGCSFADCIRIAKKRGELFVSAGIAGDGMFAVRTASKAIYDSISGAFQVSAVNSPFDLTLTGDARRVAERLKEIKSRDGKNSIAWKQLKVSGGFHSSKLRPFAQQLVDFSKEKLHGKMRHTIISTIDGRMHAEAADYPSLLGTQLYSPVLFRQAVEAAILNAGCTEFVELGPRPVLIRFVESVVRSAPK